MKRHAVPVKLLITILIKLFLGRFSPVIKGQTLGSRPFSALKDKKKPATKGSRFLKVSSELSGDGHLHRGHAHEQFHHL